MEKPRNAVKQAPPAERFRQAIEKAQQEGADTSALLLKVTLGDAAKLKRDPTVPLADISFANGEMRYLGVKVVEGDTAQSALVVAGAEA